MKYFENLPKKQFQTTIGNFSISNFFTYIDVNSQKIDESNITIDNKTTLLEASYNTYQDINSFWSFLLANSTINPFTLLSENPTIFITENKEKTSVSFTKNTAGTTSYVFPKGSIVLPYISNTGSSYSYSSVGNFNLDGPMTVIESTSYYTERMVLKDQKGTTQPFISQDGLTGSSVVVITPTSGGTYSIQKQFLPYKTKSLINEVVKVEISAEAYIEDLSSPVSNVASAKPSSSKSKPSGSSSPSASTEEKQITAVQSIQTEAKTINAYIPTNIGILKSLFISAKYN